MALGFSRPGKAGDNAIIEAVNSRFRQERLNEYWFLSATDAQEKGDAWRGHRNTERPHSTLANIAPEAFVRQASALT